ncbi:ABC transporter permease subunit [Virgibacillus doumboii]|uniref:ABC transporter permease subunit n=1 Tax=Virgibacillus doumboii TaxID=2697503 RepID=UPI0013E01C2C|nr:ABC transporter permease subunit [Virgibacillus doumboii]
MDQLIIGGKYTLFFGLLIALLRVLIGFLAGIFFAFSLGKKVQSWIEKLADSIHFIPLTIIAYVLLQPILYVPYNSEPNYTTPERIILEIIILTIFVIPLTTALIGNEMKSVLKNEFIMSARTLGGSKPHILWHHVLPHIGPRLAILLGQQFIQVLLIFIHLGVFSFFFGGTIFDKPPRSVSNEWSGFIGAAKTSILDDGSYWLAIWPLMAFMLTIFAMQFIIKGIKDVQQQKIGIITKLPKNKQIKKTEADNNDQKYVPTPESFRRVGGD